MNSVKNGLNESLSLKFILMKFEELLTD